MTCLSSKCAYFVDKSQRRLWVDECYGFWRLLSQVCGVFRMCAVRIPPAPDVCLCLGTELLQRLHWKYWPNAMGAEVTQHLTKEMEKLIIHITYFESDPTYHPTYIGSQPRLVLQLSADICLLFISYVLPNSAVEAIWCLVTVFGLLLVRS